MRIDLTSLAANQLERSQKSSEAAQKAAAQSQMSGNAAAPEDVARLSTGTDNLEDLKVKLGVVPEVRSGRVEALQKAMAEGSYTISPQRIAAAMMKGIGG